MPIVDRIRRNRHRAVRFIRKGLGHDIDGAGYRGSAVKERLAAFDDFDALHDGGRQRIKRCGAVVETIVDSNAIDQPQNVARGRTLERRVHVIEWSILGRDENTRRQGLERLRDIDETAPLDLFGGDHVNTGAVLCQFLRNFLFETIRGDRDLFQVRIGGNRCVERE
jgi:hypothetical protein